MMLCAMAGCVSVDDYVAGTAPAIPSSPSPLPIGQMAIGEESAHAPVRYAAAAIEAAARPSAAPASMLTDAQKQALKAMAQQREAKSSAMPMAPIAMPTPIPNGGKRPRVALTFDDGPSGYTSQILRILRENGARASFCVIGNRVSEYSRTIETAIGQGCEIISHTYSHENLKKLDDADVQYQLQMANSLIEQVAGQQPRYLRPPYGAVDDRVMWIAQENGLMVVKWTIDTRDWEHRDADKTYEAIMRDVKDGSIVLCHDLYQPTAEAMERVIPDLIAMGYELVTVSELFGMEPVQ